MKDNVLTTKATGESTPAAIGPAGLGTGPVRLREKMAAFSELTKPGITRLAVLTAAAGFYLASPGSVDFARLAHTLIGMYLAAGGTNALNQYWEREIDARMRRTRARPLPSGRLSPRQALCFSSGISVVGLLHLALFVNVTTALIVAASLASYVFIYTPLKQRTSLSTLIGAVPGALPIVAGWTAAGGRFDVVVWVLFWILFLWQLPHFLALAWIYREDYSDGGLAMLSVFDPDGEQTGRQALLYGLTLVPVSLLPTLLGLTGVLYFFGALALGLLFAGAGTAMLLRRTERRAWRLFYASIAYLPALLLLMVVDKLPR